MNAHRKAVKRIAKKRLSFDQHLDRTFRKTALTAAEFGWYYKSNGHSLTETKRAIRKIYAVS